MSYLDEIVNVRVDIASPVQNSSNFGVINLVGPAPAMAGENGPPDVGVYKSLKEVTDAGWVAIGENPDPIGVAALVAFSQKHPPAGIYISIQKKTGSDMESITTTLDRALGFTGWYAVAPAGVDEDLFASIAAWVEVNNKLFAYTAMSLTNPVTTEYFRSFGIFGKVTVAETDTPKNNKYAHVAWLTEGFSYTPGEETWAFKSLSTISPSVLTSNEIEQLKTAKLNYYVEVSGKGITQEGKVISGEWIDIIRFRDWMVSDMQTRVFNLMVSNPKVPYTDGGIGLVENQMIATLKQGQKQGGIDGDAYDGDGALLPGFVTSVPRAANISDANKARRVLEDCTFSARLAGAIHATSIKGNLVYS